MATAIDTAQPRRGLGRGRLYLRRFLRNRLAVAGVVIFALLVLFSAFGGGTARCSATWATVHSRTYMRRMTVCCCSVSSRTAFSTTWVVIVDSVLSQEASRSSAGTPVAGSAGFGGGR
ncbi:hypothetical protein [Streptomyces sp. NPDC048442]|uniref:hypothetical protein n=1 Tax=Streptomyces sp. NPDC048442 TaxID=3154823 RepID=UPI00344827C5